MSLSPIAIVSLAPVAQIATRGVVALIDQSQDFVSHLLSPDASSADGAISSESRNTSEAGSSRLKELVDRLVSHLRSRGLSAEEHFDLVSDGHEKFGVEGNPIASDEVRSWIEENPDWLADFQREINDELTSRGGLNAYTRFRTDLEATSHASNRGIVRWPVLLEG